MYSISSRAPDRQPPLSVAVIGVELQVREVGAPAAHRPHAVERRRDVAGHAEVVAVDVRGVRQPQRLGRVDQRLEDGARRHARGADRRVEPGALARAALPQLDAAGIDDLDGVAAGGAEQPRGVVARLRPLARGDQAQQVLVVAHQHEEAAVDDRRVVELGVRQARRAAAPRRRRTRWCSRARRSDSRW